MNLPETLLANFDLHPQRIALVFKNKKMQYKELGIQAKRVAGYMMQSNWIQKQINISIEDPIDHIICILGTALSGNYYVSITPENEYMANSSLNPEAILISDQPKENTINLEEILKTENETHFKKVSYSGSHFLCGFYTSGSTGKPKFVRHSLEMISIDTQRQIEHKELLPNDCFDLVFSFSFSASLACLFTALACGGKLLICPIKQLGMNALFEGWKKEDINYSCLSVSTFRALCKLPLPFSEIESIKSICISGEAHQTKDLEMFFNLFHGEAKVELAYATTETRTISLQVVGKQDLGKEITKSIGKVVNHKTISIRNELGETLKPFEKGEIWVSSKYAVSEYVNLPEESSQTFSCLGKQITYKTGDIGYLNKDGYLFYCGRKNNDDKIYGIKVDSFRIEQAVESVEGVDKALVMVFSNQNLEKKLVLFYSATLKIDSKTILHEIKPQLTGSKRPNQFIQIHEFPKTHSGKIDKEQISLQYQMLVFSETKATNNQEIHHSENVEGLIKQNWSKVLGISPEMISAQTDFFIDLGGDSLKALLSIDSLKVESGIQIPINVFFNLRTPRNLLHYAENSLESGVLARMVSKSKIDGAKQSVIFISPFHNMAYKHFYGSALKHTYNIYELQFNVFDPEFNVILVLDEMEQLIKSLSIKCIVGYSFSGVIAHQLSLRKSLNNPSILLLDTYNYFDKEFELSFLRTNSKRRFILEATYNLDFEFLWIKTRQFLSKEHLFRGTISTILNQNPELNYYEKQIFDAMKILPKARSKSACFFVMATRDEINFGSKRKNWKSLFNGKYKALKLKQMHGQVCEPKNVSKIIAFAFC